MRSDSIEAKAVNTIRTLAMDAVQAANSGHPGTPMALAPVVYDLWQRHLRKIPGLHDRPRLRRRTCKGRRAWQQRRGARRSRSSPTATPGRWRLRIRRGANRWLAAHA